MSTTIDQLLDFEGNTESVLVDILEAMDLPAYSSDSDDSLPIPRVDVVATLTQSGPHEALLPGKSERIYDQHQLSVEIGYVIDPRNEDMTVSALKSFRAKMRRLVFFPKPIMDAFSNQGFYFVASNSIRATTGIRQVETEEDAVILRFTVVMALFIQPSNLAILAAYDAVDPE